MFDILHRVGIQTDPQTIFNALTTDTGLSTWWTSDTQGAGEVGSRIHFNFNDTTVLFDVVELVENRLVKWQHAGNMPDAWMGTSITFELQAEERQTFIRFSHSNWQENSNFMGHCSLKWATFLMSLKEAIETGQGRPFPNDVHIDHS